jgi:hypothetical protein
MVTCTVWTISKLSDMKRLWKQKVAVRLEVLCGCLFETAQKNDEKKKSSVIIAGLWDKIRILNLQNKTQV